MGYKDPMKTADVFAEFKGPSDVARTLNMSRMAVSKWRDVVPLEAAVALEIATGGRLKVCLEDYPRLIEARDFATSQGHRLVRRLSFLAA
jgi:hypothetical protein